MLANYIRRGIWPRICITFLTRVTRLSISVKMIQAQRTFILTYNIWDKVIYYIVFMYQWQQGRECRYTCKCVSPSIHAVEGRKRLLVNMRWYLCVFRKRCSQHDQGKKWDPETALSRYQNCQVTGSWFTTEKLASFRISSHDKKINDKRFLSQNVASISLIYTNSVRNTLELQIFG